MRGVLFLLQLALAVHGGEVDTDQPSPVAQLRDWQLPTGKPPSSAEFAALIAACEDRLHATGGSLDACLAGDYGMQRVE